MNYTSILCQKNSLHQLNFYMTFMKNRFYLFFLQFLYFLVIPKMRSRKSRSLGGFFVIRIPRLFSYSFFSLARFVDDVDDVVDGLIDDVVDGLIDDVVDGLVDDVVDGLVDDVRS